LDLFVRRLDDSPGAKVVALESASPDKRTATLLTPTTGLGHICVFHFAWLHDDRIPEGDRLWSAFCRSIAQSKSLGEVDQSLRTIAERNRERLRYEAHIPEGMTGLRFR
jgi:hypothetical protein